MSTERQAPCVQEVKPIMVPVHAILSDADIRDTSAFPPPLNAAPLPLK